MVLHGLVVPLTSPPSPGKINRMTRRDPQPIGFTKKKVAVKQTEQISFKMSGPDAEIKRQFLDLLRRRGLGMREVLVEFIQHYVEFGGDLGVVPLGDAAGFSTTSPHEVNSFVGNNTDGSLEKPSQQWHNRLDMILEHASPEVRQIVTDSLENFAEVALQQSNLQDGSLGTTYSGGEISAEVQAVLQRARDAILRSHQSRTTKNRSKRADSGSLRQSG